jgi:hypothetical protein
LDAQRSAAATAAKTVDLIVWVATATTSTPTPNNKAVVDDSHGIARSPRCVYIKANSTRGSGANIYSVIDS